MTLERADLLINFQLAGVRHIIIDVTLRHEFHGSCANFQRNGEPSRPDVNALDTVTKEGSTTTTTTTTTTMSPTFSSCWSWQPQGESAGVLRDLLYMAEPRHIHTEKNTDTPWSTLPTHAHQH
jgi:hypothetical protein